MGVYEVTTEGGTYQITTEDAPTPAAADPYNGVKPNMLEKASSGFMSGVGGLSDLAQMVVSPGEAVASRLFGVPSPSEKLNTDLSKFTGVPNATKVAPDSYAHKFGEYLPSMVLGGGGVGGLSALNPLNAIKTAGSAAKLLGNNALMSGAGYLGNEVGGPAGEIAATLGLSGAQVGAKRVLSKLAPVAEKAAPALDRLSIGARQSDYAKTVDDLRTVELPEGDLASLTKVAVDDLLGKGALGTSRNASKLLKTATTAEEKISTQIGKVISEAEKTSGKVHPDFDNALNYIASGKVPAKDVERYLEILEDTSTGIAKHGEGKLSYLQQQKITEGTKWNPDDKVLNGFNRAVYEDLKSTIEKHAPEVTGLNKELQKYKLVTPILRRGLAESEASNPLSKLFSLGKTTGGIMGATLGGGAVAGPVGAVLGGGTALATIAGNTRTGRKVLSNALETAAEKLQPATKTAEIRKLLSSVLGGTNAAVSDTKKLNDIPAPQMEATTSSAAPSKTSDLFKSVLMDKKSAKPASPTLISAKRTEGAAPEKVKLVEAQIDADPVDSAIYEIESGRNPLAKNPVSTASGAFQLLKGTAKALGVSDAFDIEQNYAGYKKLRAENEARFGSDPELLYAAHYLGAPVLAKFLAGKTLTDSEQAQVTYLEDKVLPKFRKVYALKLGANENGTA